MKQPITGSCFCGAVKYEADAEILGAGLCHCRQCQHITGGTSWPFIVVPSESLKVSGNLQEFTRIGSSGKQVHAGFCPSCSTTLFGRPEVWPHIRTISASTLDHNEKFEPKMHAWTEDAPEWETFVSNIPKYDKNPTKSD